ncbi:MAG: radical SAM mobile pair system MarR family transcriptional regulator [Clostridia bacterium]|nr:radical SAM mobile pair system MarR family transcriptional regulator [Clostridia bacterium]
MRTNGGFQISKIKQLGDRVFEKILTSQGIEAFNGAQGRILYVRWQEDGVPIKTISERCGLAITSLTTMLERMEKSGLIIRQQDSGDKRKTLIFLTDKAKALKEDYDAVSDRMSAIFYQGFTEEEIRNFEEHLERIRLNLEGWQPE